MEFKEFIANDPMTGGLTLMLIGMITVFLILLLVINLSKALILIVNKVTPEEAPVTKAAPAKATIDSNTMAIIQAAVSNLTGGKGVVSNVTKL